MNHSLKGDVFTILLKGLLLAKKSMKYHSDDKRHVVDHVQQVFQSFDHVDKLEALEICVSNMNQ